MPLPAPATAAFQDTVLDHLVPHFLAATDGNRAAARHAAHHLLAAYDTRTDAELELAVAIANFSLHSLQALSDSAAPDLTLNQKLRLRSSAVSLSREGHKARRKLDQLIRARALSMAPQADAAAQPAITPESIAPEPLAPEPPASEPLAPELVAPTEPPVSPEHPPTAEASTASPASNPPPPRNPVHGSRHNRALPALTRSQQLRRASQIITENLRRNAALAAQATVTPPDAASPPAVSGS